MRGYIQKAISVSLTVSLAVQIILLPTFAAVAASETVVVPGGTGVIARLDETVSTKTHSMGNSVRMSVAADVLINGVKVIATGSEVMADVSEFNKPGNVGSPGLIEIRVKAVRAVDGSLISLAPDTKRAEGKSDQTKSIALTLICCILFLFEKGNDAIIRSGSQIVTRTIGEVSVEIK